MKSIMQRDLDRCFLCGRNGCSEPLEEHHVFFGRNRKLSEADGMKVMLCAHRCHRSGRESVHKCLRTDRFLKAEAQKVWEDTYGNRKDFIARYGKSYL